MKHWQPIAYNISATKAFKYLDSAFCYTAFHNSQFVEGFNFPSNKHNKIYSK